MNDPSSWRPQGNENYRSDAPLPPQDPELRLTIDKAALTCARNGPQFEEMMREKQRATSQLSFMNGGPFSDYYQYMLRLNIQQIQSNPPPPFPINTAPPGPNIPHQQLPPPILGQTQFAKHPHQPIPSLMDSQKIIELREEIVSLQKKIEDSENNLSAHKAGIEGILDAHLKAIIRTSENQKIEQHLKAHNLNFTEFEDLLSSIANNKLSKETISNAKRWIFDNCTNDQLREIILSYLLNRVKDEEASEYLRLHILYLINDWAYYCQRKKEDNQMKMLARYVPKMYAYCMELSKSPELKNKLEGKLLGEWEGRSYFQDSVFKQLRNTHQIVVSDRDIEMLSYSQAREQIRNNLMATYEGYEQQHNSFSQHIRQKIEQIQKQIEEVRFGPPIGAAQVLDNNLRRSRFDQTPQEKIDSHSSLPTTSTSNENWREPANQADGDDIDGHPFDEDELKPKKSYMVLPAGIMVPLVAVTDFKYEALDPEKLEMPPNIPPSQRLLAAKDAFYKGISMNLVVQSDGLPDEWDITNYPTEFLERKANLKKIWLEKLKSNGRTQEDEIRNRPTKKEEKMMEEENERKHEEIIQSIKKKVDEYYAEDDAWIDEQIKEEEEGGGGDRKSRSGSGEKSKSKSRESSRSSSRGSRRRKASRKKRRSRTRSSSSSSSTSSSSSSSSSASSRSRSSSRSRKNRRRRSISKSPDRYHRSPSPSYATPSFGFRQSNAPLSNDNKGAQLMAKMGWSTGKGLGAKESGMVNPVSGGDIRDKGDQFRGLGSSLDPFEQFRKQRSGSYHDRGSMFRK